jgi:hypothetical protein
LAVRVELHWVDEPHTQWGHTSSSMAYTESGTLLEALTEALELATPDERDDDNV